VNPEAAASLSVAGSDPDAEELISVEGGPGTSARTGNKRNAIPAMSAILLENSMIGAPCDTKAQVDRARRFPGASENLASQAGAMGRAFAPVGFIDAPWILIMCEF